jgi:cytochrome c oxidase subunit 1
MSDEPHIHMPRPSFWPIVLAAGLVLIAFGVVLDIIVSIAGVAVLLAAIAGWALENRMEGNQHE